MPWGKISPLTPALSPWRGEGEPLPIPGHDVCSQICGSADAGNQSLVFFDSSEIFEASSFEAPAGFTFLSNKMSFMFTGPS